MRDFLGRLFNLFTIIDVIWVISTIIWGNEKDYYENTVVFIGIIAFILGLNYLFLGKATLWNSKE